MKAKIDIYVTSVQYNVNQLRDKKCFGCCQSCLAAFLT